MVELINEERAKAGVPAVTLGDNRAPQVQAESSLAHCFIGHWGLDGLTPGMRYSLAGGYQANVENARGFSHCSSSARSLPSIRQVVRDAMESWMESPGHRRNILAPWPRKVSIGLAWNRTHYAVHQVFEGDYVEYDQLPTISEGGKLSLSGCVKNGVRLAGERDLAVEIHYAPPPRRLAPGEASRAVCIGNGYRVAKLRYPLTGNRFWPNDSFTDRSLACTDPEGARPRNAVVPYVTARTWTVAAGSFSVTADLRDVVAEHGPGVYSIVVLAPVAGERGAISQYSIFHQVTPPDTYGPAA